MAELSRYYRFTRSRNITLYVSTGWQATVGILYYGVALQRGWQRFASWSDRQRSANRFELLRLMAAGQSRNQSCGAASHIDERDVNFSTYGTFVRSNRQIVILIHVFEIFFTPRTRESITSSRSVVLIIGLLFRGGWSKFSRTMTRAHRTEFYLRVINLYFQSSRARERQPRWVKLITVGNYATSWISR